MIYPDNSRNFSTRNYTGEFLASGDRTHNFRSLIQYRWSSGEGPRIFGVNVLQNTVASMTYTAQSGTPYTYITDFSLKDAVYNRRYPIETNVDLNFSKNIVLGSTNIVLGIRVMNLFENKLLTPPANSATLNDWVQRGVTIADAGSDPTRVDHVVASYAAYRNIPRQVFFTLGAGFN
jgi:hypothetical protein